MSKEIMVIPSKAELQEEKVFRVAAYCRVSTDHEEQKTSLKTQVAYYTQKIYENPEWHFAGIYAEQESGTTTENRDELNRLLDDCRKGKVDLTNSGALLLLTVCFQRTIFLNEKYSIEYHTQYFQKLAFQLKDYTEKCTISFMDDYPRIKGNIAPLNIKDITDSEKLELAKNLADIWRGYGLKMDTCAEGIDLSGLGIAHAKCIDDKLIERIIGYPIKTDKDKNQRLECGCVASIDIGIYNTWIQSVLAS